MLHVKRDGVWQPTSWGDAARQVCLIAQGLRRIGLEPGDRVVIVSETILISMPLKGSAALMNHCISFIWSSFDRVEGWNSLSIHFLAAASSAKAGPLSAAEAAINATALAIVKRRYFPVKCRICFLR